MYKQCRKDSKYKGELIKEKGESASDNICFIFILYIE